MSTRTWTITFDCPYRHSTEFTVEAPVRGVPAWDRKCRAYKTVLESTTKQYRLRCKGCRYSRKYGTARLTAEVKAAKHHVNNPSHVVVVYDGLAELYRLEHGEAPLPLSDANGAPF